MRCLTFLTLCLLIASCEGAGSWSTAPYQDPDGFSLNLPSNWKVQKLANGHVVMTSPNPSEFALILPLLGRTANCATSLRNAFAHGWKSFPAAEAPQIETPRPGIATASFQFQKGQSRGAVLCAETGPRSAMLYAIAAPAAQFDTDRRALLALLQSFRYGNPQKQQPQTPSGLPLEPWREQSESAYTTVKPTGWRAQGGVVRISNNDVRTGYLFTSPDATSHILWSDVRLNTCVVPGRFSQQFTNQSPGAGKDWCSYRTGEQVAENYALRVVTPEWNIQNLLIVSKKPRPDLTQSADRLAGSLGSSNFRNAFGEVEFTGTQNGQPVTGKLIANTLMLLSPNPDLTAGSYQQDIAGFAGPTGTEADLQSAINKMHTSVQWNIPWVMANRAAGTRDTQMVINHLREQSRLGQQMFEERMAASDRRREGVNDILGNRVRLRDENGNQYEAKAGSNYYYLHEQEALKVSNPNDAVIGADIQQDRHGAIDLSPLEIIR